MASNSADEKLQSWLFDMAREWNLAAEKLNANPIFSADRKAS
jgi:hypothetical protein